MPLTCPPAEGTYRFVLRRPGKDPNLNWTLEGYEERADSRAIDFEGKVEPTIFLFSATVRENAIRRGWVDVTARWESRPRWRDPWVPEADRPFADLPPLERALLDAALYRAMTNPDNWLGGGILAFAVDHGGPENRDEVRAALQQLVDLGLLERALPRGPLSNRYQATDAALVRAGVARAVAPAAPASAAG